MAAAAVFVPLAAVLLAGTATSTPAAAPQSVTLRYGMKPGTAYAQAASVTLDLKVDPASLPPGLLAMFQSAVGDMKQDMTLNGQLDIGQKGADGNLPLQYKVVAAKATFTRAGEAKDLPSVASAAGRPPATGHVSADGRRIEIDLAQGDQTLPQTLRDQITQGLPTLPDGPMKVGDSFDVAVPVTLPGVGKQEPGRADARWVYTLKSIGADEAKFDVRQTLPETSTVTMAGGRSFRVEGGAKGTAVFSMKDGFFTSMKLDADMQMWIGMPMPASLSGGAAAGAGAPPAGGGMLELKSTIRGPISMTMAAAAAH
jgi:hypothetical protein